MPDGLRAESRAAGKPRAAILGRSLETLDPGADVALAVAPYLEAWGFAGLTYLASRDARPGRASEYVVWTTWPDAWLVRYRAAGYIDVDPRIATTAGRLLPCLWDGGMIIGRGRLGRFLDEAARCGISSGVAVSFRDARHRHVFVALDSPVTPVGARRRERIVAHLGEIMLLATTVHERLLAPRLQAGAQPKPAERDLTGRERACLALSARGLTSSDIGAKLGIAERTVHFHVGNAIHKLDALNRREAIVKAIRRGDVSVDD